jgi:polysaccharide pyruvyl transferase WcaK-like protein
MKLAVFALPYSPNLGDGAIYEGLVHGISTCAPGIEVDHIDLSGRLEYGSFSEGTRKAAIDILSRMPALVRRAAMRRAVAHRLAGTEDRWNDAVRGSRGMVIGGGQLLADADLNFPLKIARAARMAARHDVPVVLHAVGAAPGWSREGARLFAQLRNTDLRAVRARDERSLEILAKAFPEAATFELAADPGSLAPREWRLSVRVNRAMSLEGAQIGLGVTHPAILGLHGNDLNMPGAVKPEAWVTAVGALVACGAHVTLFTNGAAEDESFLHEVAKAQGVSVLMGRGMVAVKPRPSRPRELGATLAGFDAIAAHRLHALILAHGAGVPAVGFRWDRKVAAYMSEAGCADAVIGSLEPTEVCAAIDRQLARTDMTKVADALADRARAGISQMLTSFGLPILAQSGPDRMHDFQDRAPEGTKRPACAS